MDRRGSAHADQDLLFDHAEQLCLATEAQVADFVEEQRAAGGQFELALPGLVGVGECPLLVAEQFALGQRFGNRRAVDRHERLVAAAAEIVNRLGHDLLARAVLAQNQHRQIGVGHAANDRPQRLDGGALADQPHLLRGLLGHLTVGRQQLPAILGVLQGHRGMGGQLGQGLFVLLAERSIKFVDQLERAEQLAGAPPQRNTQQRARLVAELGIDVVIDRPRLDGRIDAARLSAANHLADDAAVVADSQLTLRQSERGTADQRVVWPIPEKDAGAIGFQQPRGRLGHLDQQRFQFAGLVPLADDLQDGFQAAHAALLARSATHVDQRLVQDRGDRRDCRQLFPISLRGGHNGGGESRGKMHGERFALFCPRRQQSGNPVAIGRSGVTVERIAQQFRRELPCSARRGERHPAPRHRSGEGNVIGPKQRTNSGQCPSQQQALGFRLRRLPQQVCSKRQECRVGRRPPAVGRTGLQGVSRSRLHHGTDLP